MAGQNTGKTCSIFEHDVLVEEGRGQPVGMGEAEVPTRVFEWLRQQCLIQSDGKGARWGRLGQRRGRLIVQVKNYVGVIRTPDGFQIEILPKIGRIGGDHQWARRLLLRMLSCLGQFRHIKTARAELAATMMPLPEVFVSEFLEAVYAVVKRGLRGAHLIQQGNLPYLRGKLMMSEHLRQNLLRADMFYTEHGEFSNDRPENRLIHAALNAIIAQSTSSENQRRARELRFVFADVPPSAQVTADLRRLQPERSTTHYGEALAWAELILTGYSPLTGAGRAKATSLLYPMEMLFEAFVAKHLATALDPAFRLKVHPASHYLAQHDTENWFRLEPDLLIRKGHQNLVALDTKWKVLDTRPSARNDKYNLSQADFYQLHAYGQTYLQGKGDLVLIYPKSDTFVRPLKPFLFPHTSSLRLWALPFCLERAMLVCPPSMVGDIPFSCFLKDSLGG